MPKETERLISVRANGIVLEGRWVVPHEALGTVLFAHGSGSSRFSPRNNFVAKVLRQHGLATLLIDLLTRSEEQFYENRFDIDLLTERLGRVAKWIRAESDLLDLPLGLFGASTGAASALRLAAVMKEKIYAVVSRGGRPDLAMESLPAVTAPTLLIVGGNDDLVLELNRLAHAKLRGPKELAIIPGATHLFEEHGALEAVADKASEWFTRCLPVSAERAAVSRAGATLG
jgi:pimeloyl-ACP methyl ester carboxylesterase